MWLRPLVPNCLTVLRQEKHISYALIASLVAPVQGRACALELAEFAPKTPPRDVLPAQCNGSVTKQSDYSLTPHSAACVKKQFGKNPDVDAFNRVPGIAQATCWVSPYDDFFSTPADPSMLYCMCPPYHRVSECVQNIRRGKLRAIVVRPKCKECLCPVNPLVSGVFKGKALRILQSSPPGYVSPVAMHARVGSGYLSLPLHGVTCWLGILFLSLANVTGDIPACDERATNNMKKRASVHMHIFMRESIC